MQLNYFECVQVIFLYLDHIKSEESRAMLLKKLSPPLGKKNALTQ